MIHKRIVFSTKAKIRITLIYNTNGQKIFYGSVSLLKKAKEYKSKKKVIDI